MKTYFFKTMALVCFAVLTITACNSSKGVSTAKDSTGIYNTDTMNNGGTGTMTDTMTRDTMTRDTM